MKHLIVKTPFKMVINNKSGTLLTLMNTISQVNKDPCRCVEG